MNLKKLITGVLVSLALAVPAFSQIKAGRAVQISITGVSGEEKAKIDNFYPVSDSGYVNLWLLGSVRAAGLRPEELASVIENQYKSRQIYRNPTIQVIDSSKKSIDEQTIYVGGRVGRPGPVPFVPGLTLYQAIQTAGGATEFGSMRRVKLFRGGNQREYDLRDASAMRIQLEASDTIEIPQKDLLGR